MSAADQHPFAVWVREHHGEDNNPLGDFATEIAPGLPATGTYDELRRRLFYTADEWALHVFDRLWDAYQRSILLHPFAIWLVEQYGDEADTPLGKFAREFAPRFPAEGDRATLRRSLAHWVGKDTDPWTDMRDLACFDEAWQKYAPAGDLL